MFHIFVEYFMQIMQIFVEKLPKILLKFHIKSVKYFKINKNLILISLIFFRIFAPFFHIFAEYFMQIAQTFIQKNCFFLFSPKNPF